MNKFLPFKLLRRTYLLIIRSILIFFSNCICATSTHVGAAHGTPICSPATGTLTAPKADSAPEQRRLNKCRMRIAQSPAAPTEVALEPYASWHRPQALSQARSKSPSHCTLTPRLIHLRRLGLSLQPFDLRVQEDASKRNTGTWGNTTPPFNRLHDCKARTIARRFLS